MKGSDKSFSNTLFLRTYKVDHFDSSPFHMFEYWSMNINCSGVDTLRGLLYALGAIQLGWPGRKGSKQVFSITPNMELFSHINGHLFRTLSNHGVTCRFSLMPQDKKALFFFWLIDFFRNPFKPFLEQRGKNWFKGGAQAEWFNGSQATNARGKRNWVLNLK